VIFLRCVKNSIQLSPVISPIPKFDLFIPPKLKGSLGTGTPILTPSIADLNLFKKYSEFCPTLVYMDAAFPYGFAFSISRASSKVFTLTMDKTGPNISSTTAASFGDLCKSIVGPIQKPF